jgi:hypothetical protein
VEGGALPKDKNQHLKPVELAVYATAQVWLAWSSASNGERNFPVSSGSFGDDGLSR